MADVSVSMIVVTIQHISEHYIIHLKYIQLLFVNYISVKVGEND